MLEQNESNQNHKTEWSHKKSDPSIKNNFSDVTLACEGGQQF